jgi:hypothetical protein
MKLLITKFTYDILSPKVMQVFLVIHYLLIGWQCEIHTFLFTYTGHEAAMLMFIYILFGDIGSCETTVLT